MSIEIAMIASVNNRPNLLKLKLFFIKSAHNYFGNYYFIVVQEMLRSAHNLFGGIHIVYLRVVGDRGFAIDHVLPG